MAIAIETQILPPGYLESKERIDSLFTDLITGEIEVEDKATALAIALHEEHQKIGEPIHQLIHEIAEKHRRKAKTLSNNMRVMDSAIPFQWYVAGESVSMHNEVCKPELPDVDKMAFLIKRGEYGWTAKQLRKNVREHMIEHGLITPKEKNEGTLDRSAVATLLSGCKPYLKEASEMEDIGWANAAKDLLEKIEEWELGN